MFTHIVNSSTVPMTTSFLYLRRLTCFFPPPTSTPVHPSSPDTLSLPLVVVCSDVSVPKAPGSVPCVPLVP